MKKDIDKLLIRITNICETNEQLHDKELAKEFEKFDPDFNIIQKIMRTSAEFTKIRWLIQEHFEEE